MQLPGTDEDFLNDPVVTLPFYGQNHARQHKKDKVLLDVTKNGWYHDLNRDPRTRVPAAFGTLVIQKNQEKLMQRAWQQVQKVYEANRKIRNVQFILQVSTRYTRQFFSAVTPAQLLAMTSAVHAKVLGSPTTIHQQIRSSPLGATGARRGFPSTRTACRQGRTASQCERHTTAAEHIGQAVNTGRVTPPRPERCRPGSLSTISRETSDPRSLPEWLRWLVAHRTLVFPVVLALLLILGFATGVLVHSPSSRPRQWRAMCISAHWHARWLKQQCSPIRSRRQK